MAERIGKMLAVAAFNNTGLAMFLLKAHEMKKMVIPGTISESYRMGKAIHKAKEIKGKIRGGNLTTLQSSLGTKEPFMGSSRILFIEELLLSPSLTRYIPLDAYDISSI